MQLILHVMVATEKAQICSPGFQSENVPQTLIVIVVLEMASIMCFMRMKVAHESSTCVTFRLQCVFMLPMLLITLSLLSYEGYTGYPQSVA